MKINISGQANVTIINGEVEKIEMENGKTTITNTKKMVSCSYCGIKKLSGAKCPGCGAT